jgi:hypothetical protein
VHVFEFGLRKRLARGLHVDRLSTRHAARTGGNGERLHHRQLGRGIVGQHVIGKQLKGQRLQRIAHQQRGRLVVFDMHRALAAAQDIVVYARHVVMHQRVAVDHFDRASGDVEARRIRAYHFARGKRQQRPHPLAALQRGVAHRLVQARRNLLRTRQVARESCFDARLDGSHPGGKISLGRARQHRMRPQDRETGPRGA